MLGFKVVMGAKSTSIHEQVMENTKRITFRCQQMTLQLEKLKLDKKVGLFFLGKETKGGVFL